MNCLRVALEGFRWPQLPGASAGESVALLVADIRRETVEPLRFGFTRAVRRPAMPHLSLHDSPLCRWRRETPSSSTSPRISYRLAEIQPWLMKVTDISRRIAKARFILISHHPELINQWAPSHGVQFVRDGIGSVRVEPFHGDPDSSLPPAELVARGWERG